MLWILSAGGFLLGACKGDKRPVEPAQPAGQQGVGGMGMGASSMMPMMRAQLDSMMRMSPEQMSGMMASHDRMMSEMMDRMGSDMRSMHMSGDARWTGLVDSVKSDLADLPGLQGQELAGRMKAHADRVQRLLAMHENMMKGMNSR
jgi:hypothetical protein